MIGFKGVSSRVRRFNREGRPMAGVGGMRSAIAGVVIDDEGAASTKEPGGRISEKEGSSTPRIAREALTRLTKG